MAASEILPMAMDMTVAVQGLVNLFVNMDGESRGMFIKLLVVKMEEDEVDLLLQVIDIRNLSCNDKKSDIKIEPEHTDSKNDQNPDTECFDHSLFAPKQEMSIDNKIPLDELTQHQGEMESRFECDKCPFASDQEVSLTKHLTQAHKIPHQCSYCDESFVKKKDLKKHKTTHPEYNEKKEKKTFMCDICPKSFYTSTDLKRHKNMHDGIKPFLCDQCPHASTTKSHLKEHKLGCHTENRPEDMLKMFVCEICSKSFATNERLKIHISRQHTKNNLFTCDQCSYETTHITSMKIHKRRHTGERPFVCHICSKTFIQNQHLNRHIKGVHMGEKTNYTPEKKYLCDVCSMAFSAPSNLLIHKESVHEGIKYPCDQCGHKATKRNLAHHMAAVHKGIRYDCEECDYKGTTKQSLNSHVESIHLGIKHECSQCDHKATTKSNLIQHVAYVHESIQHDCKECNYTTFKKRAFQKHMTSHRKAQAMQNQTDFSTNSPFGMMIN